MMEEEEVNHDLVVETAETEEEKEDVDQIVGEQQMTKKGK